MRRVWWLLLWVRTFGYCPIPHRFPDRPCWYRHPFGYQRPISVNDDGTVNE